MKIILRRVAFIVCILFCSMNILCEDDNDDVLNDSDCDMFAEVDSNTYKNLTSDNFSFVDAEIVDNCLNLEIEASGCDGSTWEFKLLDSGAVAESFPEQRFLKFQLINKELCDAIFRKTVSFDLTPLKVSGSSEIILNIQGLESALSYKY